MERDGGDGRGLRMNCGFSIKTLQRVWLLESEKGSLANSGLLPQEWPDSKDWSLQDTDAFVLVYDICSPDSFDYVKALRQRISETRWGYCHRCVWVEEGCFCQTGRAFAQG